VPFGEEAANALADVVIDGSIGRRAGSVAEGRRPARQQAVQSGAHARPRALLAWLQEIADLVLDALQAFPERTRARYFRITVRRPTLPNGRHGFGHRRSWLRQTPPRRRGAAAKYSRFVLNVFEIHGILFFAAGNENEAGMKGTGANVRASGGSTPTDGDGGSVRAADNRASPGVKRIFFGIAHVLQHDDVEFAKQLGAGAERRQVRRRALRRQHEAPRFGQIAQRRRLTLPRR